MQILPDWRIVRRQEPLNFGSFLLFVLAFILSLGLSALMLYALGKPGFYGIQVILEGGFGHGYSYEDTILKAMPMFLCAVGVAICFRMQVWNIGAEGQFALGAIGATGMVLAFPTAPAWVMLPGMFITAALAGIFWAAIPAFLRLTFKVNEIVSSLMLNYVGILVLQYLVYGPWKDPNGSNFAETMPFPPAAIVPPLFGRIHWGLFLCLAVGLLVSFFFKRTRLGYEIMVSGENPKAAKYAGMPYAFLVFFVLCTCGALAAIAGGLETSAIVGKLLPTAPVGYGYTAIVVAWLAKLRISRIAFFSFLLAGLRVGVENLQLEMDVPAAFAKMIEGSILLIVLAAQFFDNYSLKFTKRGKPNPEGVHES